MFLPKYDHCFLIHCCNIYGNNEGFLALLGYTIEKLSLDMANNDCKKMIEIKQSEIEALRQEIDEIQKHQSTSKN